MQQSDYMETEEVYQLLNKSRTSLYRLRKNKGFPGPVLTHPAKYSRSAVEAWINNGGVSGNWQ